MCYDLHTQQKCTFSSDEKKIQIYTYLAPVIFAAGSSASDEEFNI